MKKHISLPEHPFIQSVKTFWYDESIAGVFNVWWTLIFDKILQVTDKTILSIAGPIIEKIWFFWRSTHEVYKIYQQTPPQERLKIIHYGQMIIRSWWESLMKDILLHDPIYGVLMYYWLKNHEQTPSWIISLVSFVLAAFVISLWEYWYSEVRYLHLKHLIKNLWFNLESYEECKMLINSNINECEIFETLQEPFGLWETSKRIYKDTYLSNTKETYSSQKISARIRSRSIDGNTNIKIDSTQIVFTKAQQHKTKDIEQYNYFPIKKHKFYRKWHHIDDIEHLIWDTKNISHKELSRTLSNNPNGLLVAVDVESNWKKAIELKTFCHQRFILIEAIRALMNNFWWLQQITLGKEERK